MNTSFTAQVADWCNSVEGALDAIFKMSCQELVSQMQAIVPVDTGFLRASLVASKTEMPRATRENPGRKVEPNFGQVELVISTLETGEVLYLGYTANYGVYIHYGTHNRAPYPWVDLIAQKWQAIVASQEAIVKTRLGI